MVLVPGDKVIILTTSDGKKIAVPIRSPNQAGNKCLLLLDSGGKKIAIKLAPVAPGDKVILIPDSGGNKIAVKCGGIAPNPPDSWAIVYDYGSHGETIMSMEQHGTLLYLGIYDDPVYSYDSSTGVFTPSISYPGILYPWTLKSSSDGFLYFGWGYGGITNNEILRTLNGSSWAQVYDSGDPMIFVRSIEEHGGKLYGALHDYVASNTKILESADGLTWNVVYTSAGDVWFFNLKSFGANLYATVYVGGVPKLWRSTAGVVWTEPSATVNTLIGSSGGYAFAVGTTKIYRSTDGATWVQVQDCAPGTPGCFCEVGGLLFVGSGVPEQIRYSEDTGATWALSYNPGGSSYFIDLAVYNKRVYGITETVLYRSAEIK